MKKKILLIIARLTIKSVLIVGSEWRFLVSQNRVANATFEAIRMKNASDSSNDFTFNRFSTHFTIHVGSIDFL